MDLEKKQNLWSEMSLCSYLSLLKFKYPPHWCADPFWRPWSHGPCDGTIPGVQRAFPGRVWGLRSHHSVPEWSGWLQFHPESGVPHSLSWWGHILRHCFNGSTWSILYLQPTSINVHRDMWVLPLSKIMNNLFYFFSLPSVQRWSRTTPAPLSLKLTLAGSARPTPPRWEAVCWPISANRDMTSVALTSSLASGTSPGAAVRLHVSKVRRVLGIRSQLHAVTSVCINWTGTCKVEIRWKDGKVVCEVFSCILKQNTFKFWLWSKTFNGVCVRIELYLLTSEVCPACPTLSPTVQQCPDPGEVVNGARSVRPEAGFAVGTVVRFSCNQGYQLEGPSQISCHGRDTGTPKWSDRSPKCVCESLSLWCLLLHVNRWTANTWLSPVCSEQWNMTRAQTPVSRTTVTKPCTSTATRREKLCVSSAMRATNLSARSSSAAFPAIPLSGTARRHFAKVKVHRLSTFWLENVQIFNFEVGFLKISFLVLDYEDVLLLSTIILVTERWFYLNMWDPQAAF